MVVVPDGNHEWGSSRRESRVGKSPTGITCGVVPDGNHEWGSPRRKSRVGKSSTGITCGIVPDGNHEWGSPRRESDPRPFVHWSDALIRSYWETCDKRGHLLGSYLNQVSDAV